MQVLIFLPFLVLAILAARSIRWAYVAFVLLGLLYFPASVGFHLNPQPCELAFDLPLAIHSLTNYAHIVLFAIFFLITSAQFRMTEWKGFAWAGLAGIIMGALVEAFEGLAGKGHCRSRDLIPDTVGLLIGAAILFLWQRVRDKKSVTDERAN